MLATTMLGNGSSFSGNGENPTASLGKLGPSGFGGATNNAPCMLRCVFAAQCATSRQARLCAISTTLPPTCATVCSRTSTHSLQTGQSQSRCCTRTNEGLACSHRLCQCSGPELPMPGRMRTVEFMASVSQMRSQRAISAEVISPFRTTPFPLSVTPRLGCQFLLVTQWCPGPYFLSRTRSYAIHSSLFGSLSSVCFCCLSSKEELCQCS